MRCNLMPDDGLVSEILDKEEPSIIFLNDDL
jgi:hypothetical protein